MLRKQVLSRSVEFRVCVIWMLSWVFFGGRIQKARRFSICIQVIFGLYHFTFFHILYRHIQKISYQFDSEGAYNISLDFAFCRENPTFITVFPQHLAFDNP